MRQTFWSEPVRLWLRACGRQDLVDRGDALAQRVAALLVAVRQRVEQYLSEDDLYSGRGGAEELPAASSPDEAARAAALARVEQFVNVRLRQEIAALEEVMSVFDDLRARRASSLADAEALCERLSPSDYPGVVCFSVTYEGSVPAVAAMTITDPGPGVARGLAVDGVPFVVRRAPRSLRRMAFTRM